MGWVESSPVRLDPTTLRPTLMVVFDLLVPSRWESFFTFPQN